MAVMMKDVTFLAPSTGDAPSIWATDLVYGTYVEPPETYHQVSLSGGGLDARFVVKTWENRKWAAEVAGSGTLTREDTDGTVSTQFAGAAAGTYSGTSQGGFMGTAAGLAK